MSPHGFSRDTILLFISRDNFTSLLMIFISGIPFLIALDNTSKKVLNNSGVLFLTLMALSSVYPLNKYSRVW